MEEEPVSVYDSLYDVLAKHVEDRSFQEDPSSRVTMVRKGRCVHLDPCFRSLFHWTMPNFKAYAKGNS